MRPALLVTGVAAAALLSVVATMLLLVAGPAAAEEAAVLGLALDPSVLNWGFASAALSAGVSAAAAGYAVAQVGSAAVGTLAEKPELMGRVLVVVGLAEGIAIYGLIVAILILNRLG